MPILNVVTKGLVIVIQKYQLHTIYLYFAKNVNINIYLQCKNNIVMIFSCRYLYMKNNLNLLILANKTNLPQTLIKYIHKY